MKPSGIVIMGLAVWLGCQVFGGEALQRLKIAT